MDSGPSQVVDFGAIEKEQQLKKQQDKQAEALEKQRIKSMRGRNGAISLFADVNQNQNAGTLG